ncbi:MAG: ATP-binding protein [Sciscionella sp.]
MSALLHEEPDYQAGTDMQPRFSDQLDLATLRTAVSCARLFTEYTLDKWGASSIVDNALLVVTELVTNAVQATGVTDEHPHLSELNHLNLIRVHLLGLDSSIVIAVWDSDPYPPVQADTDTDEESSRSLQRIESVSSRWGSYPVSQGKVVWAELPVYPCTPHGLPRHPRRSRT